MEFRVDALLERYRKIFTDRSSERIRVAEVIRNISGITLSEKDITINKGILTLTIRSAAVKNEIFLRKEALVLALQAAGFKIGEIKI